VLQSRARPNHANPQAQPSLGEHIHLSSLFCEQSSLALRQHHHAGTELQAPDDSRKVTEEHKGLVKVAEEVALPALPVGAVGEIRTQDMFSLREVRISQLLNCLGKVP
jgi:hypothetical protein